jgi:1-acyl-sn-glycerol-3-phosphate acyltransferase
MSVRAVGRVLCLAVVLLLCLPAYAVARPFGGGPYWTSVFLGRVGWLLGLRVRIEGRPLPGHVLYAANHISWLDIPALGGAVRSRFIAKSEIEGWSLIGWLARLGGSVFVARQRRSETRRQADAVTAALREGVPVVLFAEGGTGDGITLDPFRASLFASANAAGVTVQPVAVDYGARQAEIAWPDGASFGRELTRMLNRPAPVPVTLRFLAPLDGARLDRKQLAGAAEAAVAGALGLSRPA